MSDDPISELEAGIADLVRRGRIRTQRRSRAIDPDLDPSCYPLISMLSHHDSVPTSTLVADLGLDKSTVTRQIDSIVRLGLATRRPDPHDGRARLVTLTETGRERVDAVTSQSLADWRARLAKWDPADVRTLTELLNRLIEDDSPSPEGTAAKPIG